MALVQPTDLTGKYAITKAFQDGATKINYIANNVEFKIFNELFGVELYALFASNSADTRFSILIPQLAFTACSKPVTTRGIKEMMKGFVYCAFIQEMQGTSTSIGKTTPKIEAGKLANDLNVLAFYNESVQDFRKIQAYMMLNKDVYPEFNGVYKRLNYWF